MAAVPASPKSGRRVYFQAGLRSRAAFWTVFAGVGGSVLLAAAWHDARMALAGPLVTVVLVLVVAYNHASKRAEREFFLVLAPALGMTYVGELSLWGITPLLAAGDRRRFEHAMTRPGCQLGLYTYEVRRRSLSDWDKTEIERTDHWDPYRFTVCVMDLASEMPDFPGVYIRRKKGLLSGDDWLRDPRFKRYEVESIAFRERYDILCAPDQEELALRQLLSPALIDWMANHPLQPGFELRGGVLVAWLPGHVKEAGKLEFFMQAAEHLSSAAAREVAETSPFA